MQESTMTDDEFLKLVRNKLDYIENERSLYFKAIGWKRMAKYAYYALMLTGLIYAYFIVRKSPGFKSYMSDDYVATYFMVGAFVIFCIGVTKFVKFSKSLVGVNIKHEKKFKAFAYKVLVLPELAKILGGLKYAPQERINRVYLKYSQIAPNLKNIKMNNVFKGAYKGVKLEFSELYAYQRRPSIDGYQSKETSFNGFYVMLDLSHIKFHGHTVLNNDKDAAFGIIKDKVDGLKRARIVDPEFEKVFDVWTNDQVEARYLLDPVVIELITKIYTQSNGKGVRAAFFESKLLILVHSDHDHFETEDVTKPILDEERLLQIKHDIDNIKALIDRFKVMKIDDNETDDGKSSKETMLEKVPADIDDVVYDHNYSF